MTEQRWRVSAGQDARPDTYWLGTAEKAALVCVSLLPCDETRRGYERVLAMCEALNRFDGATGPARAMRRIFDEVWAEQERAHAKHGDTSMRSARVFDHRRVTVLAEELGEVARVLNDRDHALAGDVEAMKLIRGELVQLAAMACDWLLSIDQLDDPAVPR